MISFSQLKNNGWVQRQEKLKHIIKVLSLFCLKAATLNRGMTKKIGCEGETFKFDYGFAFSNFRDWGDEHNRGYKTLLEISRGKEVVFDIGAHIGLCALPLSRAVKDGGTVYAFEPGEVNLMYLKKNIFYNSITNIRVYPYLVGKERLESVPFYESKHKSGMNSLILYENDGSFFKTQKRQICLDEFCINHDVYPDVIKIDVEGAEQEVLMGAKVVLATHRPQIVLSVHPKHLTKMGQSVEKLGDLIENLRYKVLDTQGQIVHKLEFNEYLLKPI